MQLRIAHGGGYVPNRSQGGRSQGASPVLGQAQSTTTPEATTTPVQPQQSHLTPSPHGGGFVPFGRQQMSGSPANVHGGGYVPNTSLGSPHGNPGLGQTQGSYAPLHYRKGLAPGQTQTQGSYAQQVPNVGEAVPGKYVPPQGPYNAYIPGKPQQGPAPSGQGRQPARQASTRWAMNQTQLTLAPEHASWDNSDAESTRKRSSNSTVSSTCASRLVSNMCCRKPSELAKREESQILHLGLNLFVINNKIVLRDNF
jgi:hypothetical protein